MGDFILKVVLICRLNMPTAPADGIVSGYCQWYTIPDESVPSQFVLGGTIHNNFILPKWIKVEKVDKRKSTT